MLFGYPGRRSSYLSFTLTKSNKHELATETCPGYGFYTYGIHACRVIYDLVNSEMGFWGTIFPALNQRLPCQNRNTGTYCARFPFPSFEKSNRTSGTAVPEVFLNLLSMWLRNKACHYNYMRIPIV